MKIEIKRRGGN